MTTAQRAVPVRLNVAWRLAKSNLERRLLQMKENRGIHLRFAATRVLQRDPALWKVYQQAMLAGLPSEFQRAKPRRDTPKERAWQRIERAARRMVARSQEPINLNTAVAAVVRRHPEWYAAYAKLTN